MFSDVKFELPGVPDDQPPTVVTHGLFFLGGGPELPPRFYIGNVRYIDGYVNLVHDEDDDYDASLVMKSSVIKADEPATDILSKENEENVLDFDAPPPAPAIVIVFPADDPQFPHIVVDPDGSREFSH